MWYTRNAKPWNDNMQQIYYYPIRLNTLHQFIYVELFGSMMKMWTSVVQYDFDGVEV